MLMILILHANYKSLGYVSQIEIEAHCFSSFSRIFIEQLCSIAVNVYILISGYFSITWKIKNILNLILQVCLYTVLIALLFFLIHHESIRFTDILIIGKSYWFIVSYLILYILSPVLNSYSNHINIREYRILLSIYFCFEIIYGWYFGLGGFSGGYSALSFIGLYLLGRYLRLYSSFHRAISIKKTVAYYLVISFIPAFFVWIYIYVNGDTNAIPISNFLIDYNCPFVIAASVLFFLIFSKLNLSSTFINYLSSSSLAVYLIHFHPSFFPYYKAGIISLFGHSFSIIRWLLLFICLILFMIICMLIDKLRLFITSKSINRFCDYLESR